MDLKLSCWLASNRLCYWRIDNAVCFSVHSAVSIGFTHYTQLIKASICSVYLLQRLTPKLCSSNTLQISSHGMKIDHSGIQLCNMKTRFRFFKSKSVLIIYLSPLSSLTKRGGASTNKVKSTLLLQQVKGRASFMLSWQQDQIFFLSQVMRSEESISASSMLLHEKWVIGSGLPCSHILEKE